MPAWLDKSDPVDVQTMTDDELLAYWAANRNSLASVMAAEEMMRRLTNRRRESVRT